MASPPTTLLCQYYYDPLDRLIHQTQPDTPVHERFYCNSRLASEIQGATQYSIVQHDDLLLAQQQRDGDALDTTLLATDLQSSVLHTLKKDHQPQPIAYSPYGHRLALPSLLNLPGFNGERPDPVTGHYLLGNGYRTFNPVVMQFNNPDNLSPFGKGGLNPYTYCFGDPINRIDPTGHFSQAIVGKLLAWASRAKDHISTRSASSLAPPNTPAFSRRPFQWSEPELYNLQELAIANIAEQPITAVLENKLRQAPQKIIDIIHIRRRELEKTENLKQQFGRYSSPQLIKLAKSGQLARTSVIGQHIYKKEFNIAWITRELRRAARNTNNPLEILTNIRMNPIDLEEFRNPR